MPKLPRLLLLAFMVLFVVGPVTSLVLWIAYRHAAGGNQPMSQGD